MESFTFKGYQMICGQAEAAEHTYDVVMGTDGKRWLRNGTGDNIYHEGDPDSKGFGGAKLTFKLKDGSSLQLKGPWHSNSEALFKRTGVDLRYMHKTFTVVARERKYGESLHVETLIDVIWRDKEPAYGAFQRGKEKAQELSNSLNERLVYTTKSAGGGCSGWVEPESWSREKANASKVRKV